MSRTDYQKENDIIAWNFLERTFFKSFRLPYDEMRATNYGSVEFMLNAACNQACQYCYLNKYGTELVPKSARNVNNILKNSELLIKFLTSNNMHPTYEIFSGDLFFQRVGFDLLDLILKYSKICKTTDLILIPTNGTFIMDDERTKKVIYYLEEFQKLNIQLGLSLSVDGKYMEENTPMKVGRNYTDNDYDAIFKFAKKFHCGFHPMIYSHRIDSWIDNFLWFQENFKKYDLPWNGIYLLEVRNKEWSDKQINEYLKFVEFLLEWVYNKLDNNPSRLLQFIFKSGFNFLNVFSTIGRGYGCSIQSCLHVRMGDLFVVPCHRTSYDILNFGKFEVNDDEIVGFKSKNVEFFLAIQAASVKSNPMCEKCMIKHFCSGQCFGSMYEATGDPFSPIPTVCKLFHGKLRMVLRTLKRLGCFYLPEFRHINNSKPLFEVIKNLEV